MSAIFLLMLAYFANIFTRFPHFGIAMDSFQVVDHREESIYGMSFEFVVLRALDVSKTAIILEKRHTAHAIRTPWARRLPARTFQREHMLECIGILRHGPHSLLQDDWLTTFMCEQYTILPTGGAYLTGKPHRYLRPLHFVMWWIA